MPLTVALIATGCVSHPGKPPAHAPSTQAPSPSPAAPPADARVYTIDAQRSQVTLLVRRGGAFAKLGHNHVIRSDAESGRAWIAADGRSSGLEVHLPVKNFVVDDPAARASAGPDFAAEVPEDARSGTYHNMTGDRVLDADHFPEVVIRFAGDVPPRETTPIRVVATVKGQDRPLDVPMVVTVSDHEIAASGEAHLRQTELGLEPFSILGGAIAVADEFDVRFEIVATR